jgi:hypothetical protein
MVGLFYIFRTQGVSINYKCGSKEPSFMVSLKNNFGFSRFYYFYLVAQKER